MPLQCGPLFITGTLDDVCFYQMDGKYYARMKSSLTRKRVLKDPKFQLTRVHAALLGEASKIASRVYRLITSERKKHALYREMTGKAIYLLREGKDKEVVFQLLCEQYLESAPIKQAGLLLRRKGGFESLSHQPIKQGGLLVSRKGGFESLSHRPIKQAVKDDKRYSIAGIRLTIPRLKKKYVDKEGCLQASGRKKRYFLALHHGAKQHSLEP